MLAEDNSDPAERERQFQEALEIYEQREGRFSPTEIAFFVKEILIVHQKTHNDLLPSYNSVADKRIKAAALRMKTDSINQSILEFEGAVGATAEIETRPHWTDIGERVEKLHKLVKDMAMEPEYSGQFDRDITRHATAALKASNVPDSIISMLLGLDTRRRDQAAELATAIDLHPQ